jgi:hypothetical protein
MNFLNFRFRILEFGFKVRLQRINLIKNDRAKRYNKSAIHNLKSKIGVKFRGHATGNFHHLSLALSTCLLRIAGSTDTCHAAFAHGFGHLPGWAANITGGIHAGNIGFHLFVGLDILHLIIQ